MDGTMPAFNCLSMRSTSSGVEAAAIAARALRGKQSNNT
jgi:hypothetical protein